MSGGKSEKEVQSMVDSMRQWINSQPHLPKDASDGLLLRFLHSCYYDLEKAKTAADLFFTMRGSSPDLLRNRDPESPAVKKTFSIINLAQFQVSGKSEKEVQSMVDSMRQWINSQPHLPKDASDGLLLRFLHSCYYDLEKAKTAADLFFTMRGSSPDLLRNRDPESPAVKKTFSIINLAQFQVSGNRNLWIWQLNDPGLDNYDYLQDAKIFILSTDAWLLEDNTLEEADIVLMDIKDISLKFLTKFNMSVARRISKYQEDAMPIRLKEIHLINVPSFIDKLFALMKPLMKQEVTDMIHFHTSKSSTLFQYLSKEDLPEDFGGTNGKMTDHMKDALDLISRHREKLNTDLWMAASKKSKSKKEKENNAEVTTGFRSLAID